MSQGYKFDSKYGGISGYDQDCMIIASFGNHADPSVHRRRKFEGEDVKNNEIPHAHARDDVSIVKYRLGRDSCRTVTTVLVDEPENERDKNRYVEEIELFLERCKKPGATIWYMGHGQDGSGDWCFRGGFLTFRELFSIYMRLFRGKVLTLVIDSPYSGQWAYALIEELDRLEVPACGHRAIQRGILVKIFASCQRHEIPRERLYSVDGCTIEDNHLIFGCALSDEQRPTSVNTTRLSCMRKETAVDKCRAVKHQAWKWKDTISGEISSRLQLVRGKCQGRPAWHYVLLEADPDNVKQFHARIAKETINVADFGMVLTSGWGDDPPEDVRQQIRTSFPY